MVSRKFTRIAKKYGIDTMVHRVATSEIYRDSPTAVRVRWAFRDFVEAHILLDLADEERAKAEAARG